ncbi:unnamed protein product [Adineta steineri]|uniref:Uncharacterized protein n=1 Tax=Adineta steineri TaxID=433720 RepID=A0A813NFT8_9BILA|nr:unnamed protein product [Adineta steineri]
MDNVVLTSASQISPNSGNPLSSQSVPPVASDSTTIEALLGNPLEPPSTVDETKVDGNFQTHLDVNYQAHDVALATAKANGHEQTNGLKLGAPHQMEIDDGYDHLDKTKSCCSMLNKLFLALAIVCFALFLCSIAFIVANLDGLNGKQNLHSPSRLAYPYQTGESFTSSDKLINKPYFNLTHPNRGGIIVILSRRGASVNDILIPYIDNNGRKQNRSIIFKNTNENHFGSIRFGFDEEINSFNMTNQLPLNYPFLNSYNEDWSMYGDINKPYRVRFVNGLIEVIYEFASSNINEFMMTTIVSAPLNEQVIADPTNNIYFNLRGYGNLSTHHLNLSASTPINIKTNEQIQQNQLIQGQYVDQLTNINHTFYKFDRAGIGKNYIATLTEKETKTIMNIFADHSGVIIDPFGVESSNHSMYGIRISPRQSPVYQPMSIYGPTLVVHPSQAIHTTWWQFEY